MNVYSYRVSLINIAVWYHHIVLILFDFIIQNIYREKLYMQVYTYTPSLFFAFSDNNVYHKSQFIHHNLRYTYKVVCIQDYSFCIYMHHGSPFCTHISLECEGPRITPVTRSTWAAIPVPRKSIRSRWGQRGLVWGSMPAPSSLPAMPPSLCALLERHCRQTAGSRH